MKTQKNSGNKRPKKENVSYGLRKNAYHIEIAKANRRYLTILSEKEGKTADDILDEVVTSGIKQRMMKLVQELDGS